MSQPPSTETIPTSLTPPPRKETKGELARSMAIAIGIALIFRSVAFEPFHIPSGSMLSTLYKGDYLFVSKFSYGYSRYSFPFSPNLFEGRIFRTAPQQGDVIVFRPPNNPRVDFIKRIVGMPGDTVQVIDGLLYLNGTAVEITRRGDVTVNDEAGNPYVVRRYEEKLPNGRTHIILNARDGNWDRTYQFDSDNTPVYTVPAGHYFVMGDNRDNSEDSRYSAAVGHPEGVGFLPEENIVGRAEVILLSRDTAKPLLKFWDAFRAGRWWKKIV